jgi:hypothetical protein
MNRVNHAMAIGEGPDPSDREEQIAALRQAREVVTDPLRDQSTYNLFAILEAWSEDEAERAECQALLEELLRSRSRYGKQWYVKRAAGMIAWLQVEKALSEEDNEMAVQAGKEAGKWYSRAIRARPRIQIRRGFDRRPWRWVRRVPTSPILYANAVDGHRVGGNRLRAWWCERRFQWIRKRFWKKAWAATENEKWAEASAFYDWIAIVGRKDEMEAFATTYAAICRWRHGQRTEGEHDWAQAYERHGPIALLARANLVSFFERWKIDSSVPGEQPTDQESVAAMVSEMLGIASEELEAEPPSV